MLAGNAQSRLCPVYLTAVFVGRLSRVLPPGLGRLSSDSVSESGRSGDGQSMPQ